MVDPTIPPSPLVPSTTSSVEAGKSIAKSSLPESSLIENAISSTLSNPPSAPSPIPSPVSSSAASTPVAASSLPSAAPSTPPTSGPTPGSVPLPRSSHAPERQAAALDISRSHRVYPHPLPNGRWQPRTISPGGTPASLTSLDYPDPVEALEAAETLLAAAEAHRAETSASRMLDLLSRAVYAPWPLTLEDGRIEWVVLRVADEQQMEGRHPGVRAALLEIGRLLNERITRGEG